MSDSGIKCQLTASSYGTVATSAIPQPLIAREKATVARLHPGTSTWHFLIFMLGKADLQGDVTAVLKSIFIQWK